MNDSSGVVLSIRESSSLELPACALCDADAAALHEKHHRQIAVKPPDMFNGQRWTLSAGTWVGQIPVSARLTVRIEPKVTIGAVFRMLEYAYRLRSFHVLRGEARLDTLEELYEVLARILCAKVLDRERKGLYRSYVPRCESLSVIRGRLDTADLFRRPWTAQPKCEFEEHTPDIEDNQLLSWTLLLIARSGLCREDRGQPEVRKAYRALAQQAPAQRFLPADCAGRLYNRLNEDYSELHALCRFFLEHSGPTSDVGERQMVPFLVNTARLFEKFVAEWLRLHLPPSLGLRVQEHVSIDSETQLRFEIDLVVYDAASGNALCVLDTKYKRAEQPAESDVQQAVAYTEAKGCSDAVLVYPEKAARLTPLRVGRKRVHMLGFDISGDLEAAGARFLEELNSVVLVRSTGN